MAFLYAINASQFILTRKVNDWKSALMTIYGWFMAFLLSWMPYKVSWMPYKNSWLPNNIFWMPYKSQTWIPYKFSWMPYKISWMPYKSPRDQKGSFVMHPVYFVRVYQPLHKNVLKTWQPWWDHATKFFYGLYGTIYGAWIWLPRKVNTGEIILH